MLLYFKRKLYIKTKMVTEYCIIYDVLMAINELQMHAIYTHI